MVVSVEVGGLAAEGPLEEVDLLGQARPVELEVEPNRDAGAFERRGVELATKHHRAGVVDRAGAGRLGDPRVV